ncbi:unnamed protein product [Knipowitschia caucasica]|uniref:Synaptonemal complex central element protein 2 n=1 Tax=Knipowitschia caucasica TaxID=637954 RepID=A0AAV2LKC3_KNICA
MDYFYDKELPSTSSSAPTSPEANTISCTLSMGDNNLSVNLADQTSSLDDIRSKVEQLVERINTSRSSDQKEIDTYQKELSDKLLDMCQSMKDQLFTVYEDNNVKIEEKLAELSEILSNCDQLYHELLEATQALSHLLH